MTCGSVELTAFRSFIRLSKPLSDFILLRVKEPRAMTDKQLFLQSLSLTCHMRFH